MNPQHEALRKFSYQIAYSINTYKNHGLRATQFNNIVIGGLGGSGIGGRIVKSLFAAEMPVPVEIIADYTLPAYVNEKTLVILASYSGNTEETLKLYEEVKKRGSTVFTLSTGGKLRELALADGQYFLQVEAGFQPRMALGFSLTLLIQIFAELVERNITSELNELVDTFAQTERFEKSAEGIFQSLGSKAKAKFVVLTDGPMEPVGIRFAQQVQENAKHECFQHSLPEMNHNVIESYYGQLDTVFFCIDSMRNERVSSRFEFIGNLLSVENNKVIDIHLDGFSIQSVYETIYLLDWISIYLADHRRVDSLNVPNISSLKEFLDQVN
ncbi:MAG: SIS domain-containing protein [Bacteroidota bacterium]